jgi:hypothetical protein
MFRRLCLLIPLCSLTLTAPLHAASPSLGNILPRGWQRGTETTITFNGARLADAQEILIYYPGITVTGLKVVNDGQVQATIKIAPDCRLGEHAFRVRTASGISELQTFYVGPLPVVDEKEPNSDFAAPQKIALNSTVHGVADSEDVDYYLVEAKKGQRLTAEVEGMRLGTTLFDPYVAILDMKRFELAASDDAALLGNDCVASVVVPADGTYVIQVRETSYAGNGGCRYRLHVGTFPRPTAVLPAGGKLGEEVEVTFLGDPAGEIRQKVKLPAQPDPLFGLFAQDAGGISPSENRFRLSDVGNVLEVEPNDAPPQATKVDLPLAVNGVIAKPGDVDFYKIVGKKGQVFDIHCYARRLRSPLDPVMILHGITSNDDAGGPDSYFRVTFPEDKEYFLEIRDHLGKGGANYAYRVEFTPVVPKLSVTIPKTDIFGYSQDRQTIPVPKGNRYATLVTANRTDFGGPLVFGNENLPKGITMHADTMHPSVNVMPVVFEAAADAPVGGTLANLTAKHADPNVKIAGGFEQAVMLVAQGNVGVFWKHDVHRAAVAVTNEVPFKISIVEPKAPLVQNGSMNIKILVERKDGFKAPIFVQNLFNPPGVGSAANLTIPEGQNEILYPFNANGQAAVGKWKIAIIAQATLPAVAPSPGTNAPGSPGGPVWVSSQLATLEVAAPFVAFNMERDAVEQGKETELGCKVTVNTPFEGPAKVKLVGLPHLVTSPDMDITKETKEFAFKVKTDAKSPPGQHKNLFCQVIVTHQGEPVVHNVGYSELRIDPPPPPKPMAATAPPPMPQAAKTPEPAKPPEKRLTRLEKLRLEQEEREKAAKNEKK